MTVLEINGRRVEVDDSFRSLSPEQQQQTVEEISRQMGVSGGEGGADTDPILDSLKNAPVTDDDPWRNLMKGVSGGKGDRVPTQPDGTEDRGLFRRVDDVVRGAADIFTFGFADEISAGLGSLTGIGGNAGDYEGNVEAQRQRDKEGGWERFAGQVAGALLLPGAAARSVPQAVGQGAVAGGLYGFGSGDGDLTDRAWNAGIGAGLGGAVGGLVRVGSDKLAERAVGKAIPTADELRQIAEAGYKVADDAGVIVKPEGMRRIATETVNDLVEFGYHPTLQPKIATILKEMERLGNNNATYKGLHTLRKIAGQVAKSSDPSEAQMATRIIGRLDDWMANLPAEDVLTGNAQQAAQGFRQGQENWARMRRSEMIDLAKLKAERRTESTGTGGNLDNAIRQNVRAILDNPKRARGMTAAEKELAEKVVRGTPTQNVLRQVGRLSPTTGGLSAMLNVGATAFNPMMAIPGGVGLVAKTVADRMTVKNAERLSQMIRSGGRTAKDLLALARNQQLSVPQVQRIDSLAKALGVSTAELAAAVKEKVGAISE